MTTGSVPPRQTFWLCRDPECEVVYFGDQGATLRVKDLRVEPGFKTKGNDALLCYCFHVRRKYVEAELQQSGESSAVERITDEVKADNCACEVRNPTGKCCLGDVRAVVKEIQNQPMLSAGAS